MENGHYLQMPLKILCLHHLCYGHELYLRLCTLLWRVMQLNYIVLYYSYSNWKCFRGKFWIDVNSPGADVQLKDWCCLICQLHCFIDIAGGLNGLSSAAKALSLPVLNDQRHLTKSINHFILWSAAISENERWLVVEYCCSIWFG